jgi:hypothetical protein
VWLDVEAPQCKTNKDCVGLFGLGYTCATGGVCIAPEQTDAGSKPNLPARWACANDMKGGFIPDDKTVTVRLDAVDLNTLKVPAGLVATGCIPTDQGCDAPVFKDQPPGADGFFEFNMPYGFEGTIQFTAPGMVPSLLAHTRPYLESVTTSGPAMLTVKAQDDLADHAGHPIEPGTGIAILEVRDCNDMAGDGISFDPVQGQDPFYFDGALPARSLSATMVSNLLGAQRESRAVAGFSNLPEMYLSFQARLASNGEPISRITLPIRADWITYVRVYTGY